MLMNISYSVAVQTHHSLYNFLHFSNNQFQDQADSFFILAVLLDNLLKQPLRFLAILALLNASIACHLRVLLYRPKTNNLISIINQLVD